jgi:amino-acid N-acetyltransferase
MKALAARLATSPELAAITRMLEHAGLPVTDLVESKIELTVLTEGDELIGVGGLEYFGHVALLRSVAIASDRRREGLGARLLTHLEQRARERGVVELVLLTQGAERFFASHQYELVPRANVPAPIKSTAEFRTLCPDSALCMSKHL